MCGIAEFRCKNLDAKSCGLEDLLSNFTFSTRPLERSQLLVSVEEIHGHCFCEPTESERSEFLEVVQRLRQHSEELVYSPNDYSDDPSECLEETWTPREAVRRYWPSLETLPMRITVRQL